MTFGKAPDPMPAGASLLASRPIPTAAINRLSHYLRCLLELEARKVRNVSSQQLARSFHLSAAQIRKDLSQVGGFGIRGVGYEVPSLIRGLKQVLGLDREHPLLLVGMGNLGRALAQSPVFQTAPFRIVAVFDKDPQKVGKPVAGLEIEPMSALRAAVSRFGARIGIVAVPPRAAVTVCRALAAAGVQGILNFAPVRVPDLPGCAVRNVDLIVTLEELVYALRSGGSDGALRPEGV